MARLIYVWSLKRPICWFKREENIAKNKALTTLQRLLRESQLYGNELGENGYFNGVSNKTIPE